MASLMRLAPLLLMAERVEDAVALGEAESRITHPDPRCVEACGVAMSLAFRWCSGVALHEDDVHFQNRDLVAGWKKAQTLAWEELPSSGYVVDTLASALWCVFRAKSFEEGVLDAVNLGDDADTVGAVAGMFLGARFGLTNIPPRWIQGLKGLPSDFSRWIQSAATVP